MMPSPLAEPHPSHRLRQALSRVCTRERAHEATRREREREHLERVIEIEIEIVCEGCRVGEEGARAEGRPSYPIPPWLLMSRYSAWAAILHHAFAPCKPVFSPTRTRSLHAQVPTSVVFSLLNNRSKLFGFQNVDPKTQSRLVARSLQGEARCRERRLEPGYREPHACVLPHRGPRSRESVTTKPAAAARLEFQDLVRVSDGGAGRADGGRGRPS
jgi:hypothetical protein